MYRTWIFSIRFDLTVCLAEILLTSLTHTGAIAVTDAQVLQSTNWPITVFQVDCMGDESMLSECMLNDDVPAQCEGLQAALVCQGIAIMIIQSLEQ